MRLSYLAVIALIAATGLGSGTSAKSLAEASSPVNFPPSGFTGRTFVDNDGCVYLRAGVDGNTTWVPRVTRSRTVICGQRPTFGATQVATAPPPPPTATRIEPAAEQTAAAPETAARPVTRPVTRTIATAPAPAPTPRPVQRVRPATQLPAPVVTVSPPQPTTPKAKRRVVTTASAACANAPASSQAYINSSGVRCGPQTQSPSSGYRILQPGETVAGGAKRVVVAKVPEIPEGYRAVWTDGRLNPQRGLPKTVVATSTGYDLAWTRKAPHLLYDRKTGIVVGDKFPQLVYPNTDLSKAVATPKSVTTKSVAPKTRVSTKAVAPKVAPKAPVKRVVVPAPKATGHTLIQVATYADMAQAKAAAQKLANAGLKTRIGKYRSGGEARQVIVLGPFSSANSLNAALKTTHRMGFRRAFTRK